MMMIWKLYYPIDSVALTLVVKTEVVVVVAVVIMMRMVVEVLLQHLA